MPGLAAEKRHVDGRKRIVGHQTQHGTNRYFAQALAGLEHRQRTLKPESHEFSVKVLSSASRHELTRYVRPALVVPVLAVPSFSELAQGSPKRLEENRYHMSIRL